MYREEAETLRKALGQHCLDLQHMGSTSVPGLDAKEDLDILCVVDALPSSLKLKDVGYIYKGEFNIPLRYFFSKNTEVSKVNLHVVEPSHGFIELNLCFREYLRQTPSARKAYGELKKDILLTPKVYERVEGCIPRYTFYKNDFIKKTLEEAGYKGTTINFCAHDAEWEAAKKFRQTYFFDKVPLEDPYTWTFTHPDHVHLVFYQGRSIVGYAHIQLWPDQRAAIRIIVINESHRKQGLGRQFLMFLEKWLKSKNYKSVHTESSPEAVPFYRKMGYVNMPFDDPDGYEGGPQDAPLGKFL